MTPNERQERNAAYRSGLCVELCGRKYSPGRTRCEGCHAVYAAGLGQVLWKDEGE